MQIEVTHEEWCKICKGETVLLEIDCERNSVWSDALNVRVSVKTHSLSRTYGGPLMLQLVVQKEKSE